MDVLMFGPPGAGKGTQGKILADRLGVPHLSMGELVRQEMAAQTSRGFHCAEYVLDGKLVPDDIVISMCTLQLALKPRGGMVFDGFPRTEIQAIALDAVLQALGRQVDRVIRLDVPTAESERRMLARGRSDDDLRTVRKRMYPGWPLSAQALKLETRYRAVLTPIDAMPPVDEVSDRIWKAIGIPTPA